MLLFLAIMLTVDALCFAFLGSCIVQQVESEKKHKVKPR